MKSLGVKRRRPNRCLKVVRQSDSPRPSRRRQSARRGVGLPSPRRHSQTVKITLEGYNAARSIGYLDGLSAGQVEGQRLAYLTIMSQANKLLEALPVVNVEPSPPAATVTPPKVMVESPSPPKKPDYPLEVG